MLVSSKIFGLILTACVMDNSGNITDCEDHIIDVSPREQTCYNQMEREQPKLLELETLSCRPLKDDE